MIHRTDFFMCTRFENHMHFERCDFHHIYICMACGLNKLQFKTMFYEQLT